MPALALQSLLMLEATSDWQHHPIFTPLDIASPVPINCLHPQLNSRSAGSAAWDRSRSSSHIFSAIPYPSSQLDTSFLEVGGTEQDKIIGWRLFWIVLWRIAITGTSPCYRTRGAAQGCSSATPAPQCTVYSHHISRERKVSKW